MPEQITTQELDKAARNLAKISEFLASRREWPLGQNAEEALHGIQEAARGLGEFVTEMMMAQEIEPAATVPPLPEILPPGRLNPERIMKFTGFLQQLLQWFEKYKEGGAPLGGHDGMRSIHLFLGATYEVVESMLNPPDGRSTAPELEPQEAAPASAPAPVPECVEVDKGARLVLEDTETEPLLQKFKGIVELTPDAIEIIDVFLAVNQIEFTDYEKRKLLEKILHWVENTPDGQVLILKISGLQGRPTPYSSYQLKETLEQDEDKTEQESET